MMPTDPTAATSYAPVDPSYPAVRPQAAPPDGVTVLGKVLSIIGIVTGSLAALLSLIPVIQLFGLAFLLPTLVLGGTGTLIAKIGRRPGIRLGLIALGLAGVAVVLQVLWLIVFALGILGSAQHH